MRLKQLTNLNTLLLLTVCLALGITLWWSQRAMERPFQLLDQYLELSQRFDEQVARNIRQYLGSGDAVRQQAALQALESLAEALPELPPDLARTLAPSLAELREFSAGDLLAAGKLAGDPQGLLLQAERDLTGNLEQWSAYLDAAAGQPQAGAYRTPLLLASLHLTRLSLARAKLVESANPALAGDVERELANLREQAGRIEALPLLGVLDEQRSASDDFAAMMGLAGDAEAGAGNAEDRGVALRRELASLLQRYPDELRRTRDLIERRQQLSADTGARLDAVRQALATLEPQVRGERQRLQGQVRLIQGGMGARAHRRRRKTPRTRAGCPVRRRRSDHVRAGPRRGFPALPPVRGRRSRRRARRPGPCRRRRGPSTRDRPPCSGSGAARTARRRS